MDKLGLSLFNFIGQVVVFLVVVGILWKWALPTVTKFLDERANVIQSGLDNAEKAKKQLDEAEKRVADMLEQARQEGQQALARATQAGDHLRTEIEQQARQRADEILAQAQKNIDQQVARAKSDLNRQVSDLAILAAERVIGHSMNSDDNRKLVQDFVAQSSQSAQSSQPRDAQC
jgi:F-type H+-transporting ATPase subunit b